eukprot:1930217-Pyramimonas_sp.AAC.1
MTLFYGSSSCANNGEGALNTPETLPSVSRPNTWSHASRRTHRPGGWRGTGAATGAEEVAGGGGGRNGARRRGG